MIRSFVLVVPVLLASAGLTSAQYSYFYPTALPGDGRLLVKAWYEHYLGREPDPGALYWIRDLQQGYAPEQVLSTILSSQEYLARAGGTRTGLVRQLFLDVVGRQPTDAEMDYWQGRLRLDSSRDVAYQMLTRYPQDWTRGRGPAAAYHPGYYPGTAGATSRDPVGPYIRVPSHRTYEYRRPVRRIIVTPP